MNQARSGELDAELGQQPSPPTPLPEGAGRADGPNANKACCKSGNALGRRVTGHCHSTSLRHAMRHRARPRRFGWPPDRGSKRGLAPSLRGACPRFETSNMTYRRICASAARPSSRAITRTLVVASPAPQGDRRRRQDEPAVLNSSPGRRRGTAEFLGRDEELVTTP